MDYTNMKKLLKVADVLAIFTVHAFAFWRLSPEAIAWTEIPYTEA